MTPDVRRRPVRDRSRVVTDSDVLLDSSVIRSA